MKTIIKKGTNEHIIFLLHGTGGDASSLIDLGRIIDPNATLVGVEGTVLEQGMRRFFKRYPDGTFDLDSLKEATIKLHQHIQKILEVHGFINHRVVLLGYSNGANIAINLWKEFETTFHLGLLFHPSLGRGDVDFQPQSNLALFFSKGDQDPFITTNQFEHLVTQARDAKIPTIAISHPFGHELREEEVVEAQRVYQQVMN